MQRVYQPRKTKRRTAGDIQPGLLRGATETRTPAGLHRSGPQQCHPTRRPAGRRVRPADGGL